MHWSVVPLKRLVDARRPITYGIVQAGPYVPDGIPYIRPADMSDEEGVLVPEELLRTSPEVAESYRRSTIRTGDLVCSIGPSFGKIMVTPFCLDGANLTQGTARVAVASHCTARFVFWALRSHSSTAQWESSVGGATFRALNLGPLSDTSIAVPPLAEQLRIARFLDRETSKIDKLIAAQRRLVELLQEKRRAEIEHAVTHGLTPAASVKPSGVEWLGDIPADWQVQPLAALGKVLNGFPFNSRLFDANAGVPLVRIRDLNRDETEARYVGELVQSAVISQEDVLIGMDGDFNVGRWRGEGIALLNQRVCCVRIVEPQLAKLVEYALPIPLKVINDLTHATTVKHLSSYQVEKIRIAIPPSAGERARLIAHLDQESLRCASLIEQAARATSLLAERRAALISAAVTGKIDVRGLANADSEAA